MDFKIDKEFQDLLAELTMEETKALTESLIAEGCREAILVWNGLIVDGHNRFRICEQHSVKYEVREMEFADRDEAMAWIIRNQFSRRNLSVSQRALLAAKLAKLEKGRPAKQRPQVDNGQGVTNQMRTSAHLSQDQIAAEAGVSRRTIQDAKVVLEEGDEEAKHDVESGRVTVKEAVRKIRGKKKAKEEVPVDSDNDKPKASDDPVKDEEGVVITNPEIAALFARREAINALLTPITKIKSTIKQGREEKDELFVHMSNGVEIALGNAFTAIRHGLPYAVCVYCKGRGRKTKDCKCCKGTGWVNKDAYRMSASELKGEK